MEQAVQSALPSAPPDFPPKKLARQLDFTECSPALPPGSARHEQPLSHPSTQRLHQHQQQPPHVLQQAMAPPSSQAHSLLLQQQAKPQTLPPSSQQSLPPAASLSRQPIPIPLRAESPKAQHRPSFDVKEGTPKKQKQCNCKNSRCLKLYCECFTSGVYCDGCNCLNCYNNVENEHARKEAIGLVLERNPNAFRPKIASSPNATRDNRDAGELHVIAKHNKGCNCKKSGCLKKYCECFQANILCSENCKCVDCKNFDGSEERRALFHGDYGNSITYAQHATNAAITGAIGNSGYGSPVSKKRKHQENFLGTLKEPASQRIMQIPQVHRPKVSVSNPSVAGTSVGASGIMSTKVTLRPLLADVLRPQEVRDLCARLVVLSKAAADRFTEKTEHQKNCQSTEPAEAAPSTREKGTLHGDLDKSKVSADCVNKNNTLLTVKDEIMEDILDVRDGERPLSPATRALMCDEQGTMFSATAPQTENIASKSSDHRQESEVYQEQERLVLSGLRDWLQQIVIFGRMKEARLSMSSKSDASVSSSKSDTLKRGQANDVPSSLHHGIAEVSKSTSTSLQWSNFLPPQVNCAAKKNCEAITKIQL